MFRPIKNALLIALLSFNPALAADGVLLTGKTYKSLSKPYKFTNMVSDDNADLLLSKGKIFHVVPTNEPDHPKTDAVVFATYENRLWQCRLVYLEHKICTNKSNTAMFEIKN